MLTDWPADLDELDHQLITELAADPFVQWQVTSPDKVFLAGCSMAKDPAHPKKNWVTKGGGLPDYICRVARAIHRRGIPTSQAIAIAVSRMKAWVASKHTHPSTKAKAAKGTAEWEALRARSRARSASHGHASLSVSQDIPQAAPGTKIPEPPAPKDVLSLAGQAGTDSDYARSAGVHLTAAAKFLEAGDEVNALTALRSAQTDLGNEHHDVMSRYSPLAAKTLDYSPGQKNGADTAPAKALYTRAVHLRGMAKNVGEYIEALRRRHFHGMYGNLPSVRFTKSSLEKVLRLAR